MACRTVAIMVSLGVHHRIAQFLPRPTLQLLFGPCAFAQTVFAQTVVLLLKLSFSWSVHSGEVATTYACFAYDCSGHGECLASGE